MITDRIMKNIRYSLKNSGNMKILILGSEGMAGRYINNFLPLSWSPDKCPEIIGLNRDKFNAFNADAYTLIDLFNKYRISKGHTIINCIGTIKPRVDELGKYNAIIVNSVLPHILSEVVSYIGVHLIHITTDCVFSGKRPNPYGPREKGNYAEDDPHDAEDVYGKTKSLGEQEYATIIRTSIIGEEKGRVQRSLLQWVIDNKGKSINGYTNHYWNGITCLRLTQIIGQIISTGTYWSGVKHVYSHIVSKYELVRAISNIYNLDITVVKTQTPVIDRTLRSTREDIIFDQYDIIDDIKKQKESLLP